MREAPLRFPAAQRLARAVALLAALSAAAATAAEPRPTARPVTTAAAPAPGDAVACLAEPELTRLRRPLVHFARRLVADEPVKIVALGSSSTSGLGASSPAAAYPSRLEAELRARFPGRSIVVLNRGVNGNETREMMLRFQRDVVAERPHLVIWQVGTNTLLSGHDKWNLVLDVRAGVRLLEDVGSDVILMNLQYSPRVLARADHEAMLDLVALAGRETDIDVFDRFRVMKGWAETRRYPFETFVTPDGLHMNDWGYGCLAHLLAEAIERAVGDVSAGR